MHEKHAYRLIRDLFAHKEEIFGELKRASTLSHTPSGGNASNSVRMRAISTDESNRRANMEARNRAIASKSRNSSPAPHPNGRSHRRDRSSDPPATRFPIHTSSPVVNESQPRRAAVRASLEVPEESTSPVTERQSKASNVSSLINSINNNNSPVTTKPIPEDPPPPSAQAEPESNYTHYTASEETNGTTTFAEKRESLNRSSRFPPRKAGTAGSMGRNAIGSRTSVEAGAGNRDSVHRDSMASLGEEGGGGERQGVQLIDKPMDD